MTIATKIREARVGAGFSQEGLARATGVSLNTINALERGRALDPHMSTLLAIAVATDTPLAELAGETQAAPKARAPQRPGPRLFNERFSPHGEIVESSCREIVERMLLAMNTYSQGIRPEWPHAEELEALLGDAFNVENYYQTQLGLEQLQADALRAMGEGR